MNSDPMLGCTVDLDRTAVAMQYQTNRCIAIMSRKAIRYPIRIQHISMLQYSINLSETRTVDFFTWTQHFKEAIAWRI